MLDIFYNCTYCQIQPTTLYNIIHYYDNLDGNKETQLLNEAENIKGITDSVMKDIFKNNNGEMEWHIERPIVYNGNIEDLYINSSHQIIGNDKKNVYHLVFKTDYNKLKQSIWLSLQI